MISTPPSKASPAWRVKDDLLQSVPGVGPGGLAHPARRAARTRPARPTRRSRRWSASRRSPATAARCAGKRLVYGGRAPCARCSTWRRWSRASCNPVIRAFYQRLRAAGKPAKVALTACMRKLLTILNAMARSGTPWHPTRSLART